MKTVGIYRTAYPLTSETFIREQAKHLSAWRPRIITRRCEGPSELPVTALGTADERRVAQLLWTLTRWPGFMPLQALRDVRLIHAHFGFDAVMVLPLARRLGVPLITTLHGCDATTDIRVFRRSTKLTEQWFGHCRPALQREGQAFIAVSRFIEQELLRTGYPREKVVQHYVGTDTERFAPVACKAGPRYVLNVARHSEVKGVDTLLRAWALVADRHPDVQLWQVGGGELTQDLHQLATTLEVAPRVRFMGPLDHAQVLPLMQQAEAFCLTSQTTTDGAREALGIVLNEASACGVPLVATRHGGIPEAVLHGETGLLCDERDPATLAQHLDTLLSDRGLAASMGQRGREFVNDCFNIRTQSRKLESIYDTVVAQWQDSDNRTSQKECRA